MTIYQCPKSSKSASLYDIHVCFSEQQDREGTEVDASAVESTFLGLGFEVTRHNDLPTLDISIILRKGKPIFVEYEI